MMRVSGSTSGAATAPSRLCAVLGPTNTGKTHFAVERMLAHESGMMGFPLRLLAREIYDRIVAIVGPSAVALMTGEEKIGGRDARYIIATVEAMPLERSTAFMAIDEIQLCADPERGHIFTDRLLHARGWAETLLLGSDTIRPLLRQLTPEAEIIVRPRFSTLAFAGATKLNRLPRRSAVVAFSAAEVYRLAELVRRQKGGAAVVLGALSPRTRNAQVALYQSGEVDHLVATDAIGMGLNMDLGHVAFAEIHKFDGRETRGLRPPEVAQIAGRAGRHTADGTFGTTNGCPPLNERTIEAVEGHSFSPLKRLLWRNSDLDFSSLEALLESLDAPPPAAGLSKMRDALDARSLAVLSRRPDVRERALEREGTALLWQVCQIPDFRKTLTDAHLELLATVFRHLTSERAVLPPDYVGRMIARLERTDGDIDALVARIAHIRTWTYLSHREDWFDDAAHWQGIAREVEDRLSDALHERLTQKFIDRRTAALLRNLREQGDLTASVDADGEVVVDEHRVGRLDGFVFTFDPGELDTDRRLIAGAARRAVGRAMVRRVRELTQDPDTAFQLDGYRLCWRGAIVARICAGHDRLRPSFALRASNELVAAGRKAIERRLGQWLERWLEERIGTLQGLEQASRGDSLGGIGRGLAYRLVEQLGVLRSSDEQTLIRRLPAGDRQALSRMGVRFGVLNVYLPALLKPASLEAVSLLWSLAHDEHAVSPRPGRVLLREGEGPVRADAREALGFVPLGPVSMRVDIVERLAAQLRAIAREQESFEVPPALLNLAGLTRSEFTEVLPALGFRAEADGEGRPWISRLPQKRRERASRHARKARARSGSHSSPFAVLAQLKTAP